MFEKEIGYIETGKICTGCPDTLSQSIGRGRISRKGSLVVRKGRDRRDKIFAEENNAVLAWNFITVNVQFYCLI